MPWKKVGEWRNPFQRVIELGEMIVVFRPKKNTALTPPQEKKQLLYLEHALEISVISSPQKKAGW